MNQPHDGAGLEEALERLEEIATRLERGELGLDEALALYEEGVRHIRAAETVLQRVETRIEHLHQVREQGAAGGLAEGGDSIG